MANPVDYGILFEELQRTIEELQSVVTNIDDKLLEGYLNNVDETVLSPALVRDRVQELMIAHSRLNDALYRTQEHWVTVVKIIVQGEEKDQRRNVYDSALLHWRVQGGDRAQAEARDLIHRLDVNLRLWQQRLPPSLQQDVRQAETLKGQETLSATPVITPNRTTPQGHGPSDGVLGSIHRELSNLSLHHARSAEELPAEQHDLPPRSNQTYTLPQAILNSNQMYDQFVRLPKFELPTFVGEIEKFPSFWDAYNSAIHSNSMLPPVVKFHHLKSLLKGEALAVVTGYDLTAENYEYAVRTLRETYYRPQLIRMQLSTRLQQMKPASTSALHQRTTLAQIKSLWLQLQKHGDHEDNIYVMRFIRQKFPQRTLEHLGNLETADPVPWRVPQLLDGLDRAIRMFEVIEDTAEQKPAYMQALTVQSTGRERSSSIDSSRSRSSTPVRPADLGQQKLHCVFCRRTGHLSADCDLVITPETRNRVVIAENLCRSCFARGHRTAACDRPPCTICGRDHHETLCFAQNRSERYRGTWSGRTRYPTPCPDSTSPGRRRPQSRSPSANRRYSSREVTFREPAGIQRRGRSPHPDARRRSPSNSRQNSVTATKFDSETTIEPTKLDSFAADLFDMPYSSTVNSSTSFPSDPRLMVVTSTSTNMNTRKDEVLVMLLDSGAQHSFIKEDTAKRLGLRFSDPRPFTTRSFGGHVSTEMSSLVTAVLRDQTDTSVHLQLRTRKITTTVRANAHILRESGRDSWWKSSNIPRSSSQDEEVDVDILIGIDYYWSIVDPTRIRQLPSGLTYAYTRFGPTLSGQEHFRMTTSVTATISFVNVVSRTDSRAPDFGLRRLWDLQSLGIHDDPSAEHDDEVDRQVIKRFYDTVKLYVTAKLAFFAATTKRIVLRTIASNFDLLGHLTPLFISVKVFLQDLWRAEYEWDQPLSDQDVARWSELVNGIEGCRCSILRFIVCKDEHSGRELLVFADASRKAFFVVAYLLSRSGYTVRSYLLIAKAREAPLDVVTKPRLELMACHSAVLHAQFLCAELKVSVNAIRIFSDSHIALHWIHSNRPLKTFAVNRVQRIRTIMYTFKDAKSYHISLRRYGSQSSSCATREISAREVSKHIYWKGPPYNYLSLSQWPNADIDFTVQPDSILETDIECKETVTSISTFLETFIVEIEAMLDIRPLTLLSAASSVQFNKLRPFDFISPYFYMGHFTAYSRGSPFFVYDLSDSQAKEALRESHDMLVTALDHFWKPWCEDYFQSLAHRQQKSAKSSLGSGLEPAVGGLVIVKTEGTPRAYWPLAVVMRLHVSKESSIRCVRRNLLPNELWRRKSWKSLKASRTAAEEEKRGAEAPQ